MTLQATALQNLIIGGPNGNVGSIRFPAKTKYSLQSPLASSLLYWITNKPGYSAGSGGIFAHELHKDNNGQPGDLICTAWMVVDQPTENGIGKFSRACFAPDAMVTGDYYHEVIRNIDVSPKTNFSSLDFLTNPKMVNQTPDMQVLVQQGGGLFKPLDGGIVVGSPVSLVYFDGTVDEYDGYEVVNGAVLAAGPQYGFVGGAA